MAVNSASPTYRNHGCFKPIGALVLTALIAAESPAVAPPTGSTPGAAECAPVPLDPIAREHVFIGLGTGFPYGRNLILGVHLTPQVESEFVLRMGRRPRGQDWLFDASDRLEAMEVGLLLRTTPHRGERSKGVIARAAVSRVKVRTDQSCFMGSCTGAASRNEEVIRGRLGLGYGIRFRVFELRAMLELEGRTSEFVDPYEWNHLWGVATFSGHIHF